MASRPRPNFDFDTVLDAVSDLGMDPNGNQSIDGALNSAESSRTLIRFPPGEYLLTNENRFTSNHFGIQGAGQSREDVVFTIPQGEGLRVFNMDGDHHQLLENFTLDQRDDFTTKMTVKMRINDAGLIKDIWHRGWEPNRARGSSQSNALAPLCKSSGGQLVVDNYRNDGRRRWREYNDNNIMVWVGGGVSGKHVFINCHFENGGEHAIYGDAAPGPMQIENCVFKNNQNTHARISGGDSSWVKDSVFLWTQHPNGPADQITQGSNHGRTGLVWSSKFDGTPSSGGLVDNCDFVHNYEDKDQRTFLIRVGLSTSRRPYGGVTIRNSRFGMNTTRARATAVYARDPDQDYTPDTPHSVNVENCHFTGITHSDRGIVHVIDRDGSVVEGSCFDVDGSADGVVFEQTSGTVRDSSITVGGQQLVGVSGTGITSGQQCVVADAEGGGGGGGQQFDHQAIVRSILKNDAFGYELTTTGEVQPDAFADEPPDTSFDFEGVRQNGDGTWTAFGVVGFGGADTWQFNGEVVSLNLEDGYDKSQDVKLTVDNQTISLPIEDGGGNNGGGGGDGGQPQDRRLMVGALFLGGALGAAHLRKRGGRR